MNSEERSNEEVRANLEYVRSFGRAPLLNAPAASVRLLGDVESLLARIAAVEAERDRWREAADAMTRVLSTNHSLTYVPTAILDRVSEARFAALAASPTPTGPEPATACDHGRTEAHDYQAPPPITGADIWHCPGPATPEPTEEQR